jgi:aryl-alcohol dehydrogenase-like predicted oxidoreductase
LETAQTLGINLIDTAPAYGSSETRLGQLLTQISPRAEWILVTKAGETFTPQGESRFDFSPNAIIHSVEQSLRALRTAYLDVVLIHSDGNDMRHIEENQVLDTLQKLKTRGDIRAFGMSTKTIAGGLATVEQADVAMVTYNPEHQTEKSVIDRAVALNKGILIKKALNSGHVTDIEAALALMAQTAGISSTIIGTIHPQHLRDNVLQFEIAALNNKLR